MWNGGGLVDSWTLHNSRGEEREKTSWLSTVVEISKEKAVLDLLNSKEN